MVKKYPRSYKCLEALADVLLQIVMCAPGFSKEEVEAAKKEGLMICDRIMEDCTDDTVRTSVRSMQVLFFDRSLEAEKALETAKYAPSL